MGEIFGAAGQIASAAIQAGAIRDATQMQIDALQRQRDFVFQQLEPGRVNREATAADVANQAARLVLQGQMDPALLRLRYAAEAGLERGEQELGRDAERVSRQAVEEAILGTPGAAASREALIDAAMAQLEAGASLPPDVQNELVRAGLEQSGMTTGAASGRGVGGQLLRTILGTAGLNLQMQRQQQAANLLNVASNLETQRQNILQQLFPNLAQTQIAQLGARTDLLGTSQAMRPQAGLTGTDVANIWLARVGATNQLAQSAADAAARGTMGVGQAWGQGIGAASGALGSALPLSTVSGWIGLGGSSNTAAQQRAANAALGIGAI